MAVPAGLLLVLTVGFVALVLLVAYAYSGYLGSFSTGIVGGGVGFGDRLRWLRDKAGIRGKHVAVIAALFVGGVLLALVLGELPSDDDSFEFAALVYLAGCYFFVRGFAKFRRLQLIRNTPTSRVRSLAMGPVELYGTAESIDDDVLTSPFSGEDCVMYKYKIEEYRRSGDDYDWVTVDADRDGVPFYLDDGTGRVVVDPEGVSLNVPQDNLYSVDDHEQPPGDVQGGSVGLVSDSNDRRYHEHYVTPGEEIYVYGEAFRRDGDVVVNKRMDTPMFMVSDSSEEELVDSMSGSVVLSTVGGLVLAAVGLGLLLLVSGVTP